MSVEQMGAQSRKVALERSGALLEISELAQRPSIKRALGREGEHVPVRVTGRDLPKPKREL